MKIKTTIPPARFARQEPAALRRASWDDPTAATPSIREGLVWAVIFIVAVGACYFGAPHFIL